MWLSQSSAVMTPHSTNSSKRRNFRLSLGLENAALMTWVLIRGRNMGETLKHFAESLLRHLEPGLVLPNLPFVCKKAKIVLGS